MQSKVPIITLGVHNQGGKLRVIVLLTQHPRQPARLVDHSMQTTQCIRDNSLFTRPVLERQLIHRKEWNSFLCINKLGGEIGEIGWQVNQRATIYQHMSAYAIKVRMLLFDGHNHCKQLTFMGCIVMWGSSPLFAVILRL